MNEFEMIQSYFRPLTMNRAEAGGLKDDAAILDIPQGYELVISSDTLNEGVHFVRGESAANIAHKALRVNLSDMAAMGANPYCYQLNLAFSDFPDEAWAKEFSAALLADNQEFGIFCSGGDTTVTEGPLLVSMTITGLVLKNNAVKRSGAKDGDLLVVSGTIGDAAIGVKVLLGLLKLADPAPFLKACHTPMPRTPISHAVSRFANAGIDISDGFIADIGHVSSASGLAARVELDKIPLSAAARGVLETKKVKIEQLLTGGDDYELALAVPHENFEAFQKEAAERGVQLSVVGVFEQGQGVRVFDGAGKVLAFDRAGWTHF